MIIHIHGILEWLNLKIYFVFSYEWLVTDLHISLKFWIGSSNFILKLTTLAQYVLNHGIVKYEIFKVITRLKLPIYWQNKDEEHSTEIIRKTESLV